ncbi:peptidylprolyl isomerase [Labilithrix luteola]|nr:peptidylprolyl isomerase [Labilithrix luteola]
MPAAPRFVGVVALLTVLASGLVTACSSSSDSSTAGGRYSAAPAMTIDANKHYSATITTAKGTITLDLDPKSAPISVNNFVFLARDGYYDGLTFHRVEANFVVQGGDPTGTGNGGPGYTIPDEASPLLHTEGALGMAKSTAPNSAGSQFYMLLSAQPSLDGRYTVFGKVSSGMDVLKTIARGDVMTKVTITEQ